MAAGFRKAAGVLFGRYLVVTNTAVSGCLMAAGDAAAQMIEKGRICTLQEIDFKRTSRYFTYGLLLGPINHGWYNILDKMLPGATKSIVVKKIALDQTIAGPLNIMAFFIGLSSLEGKPLKKSVNEATNNFWNIYKLDLAVWPAAQLLNFFWIPREIRMIYVCSVSFGWTTFLAYYRHSHVNESATASVTGPNINYSDTIHKKIDQQYKWILNNTSIFRQVEFTEEDETELFQRRKKVLEKLKVT